MVDSFTSLQHLLNVLVAVVDIEHHAVRQRGFFLIPFGSAVEQHELHFLKYLFIPAFLTHCKSLFFWLEDHRLS